MVKRIAKFDNMKFILIFLVVLGHTIEPLATNQHFYYKLLYLVIYSFHMPLFVFISGYFAKIDDYTNLIRKFLLPYIIFQMVYSIYGWLVLGWGRLYFIFSTPNFALWYLLALFIWNLLLPQIIKFKHPIIYTFILGIIIGYEKTIGSYFALSRTIYYLPFFLLGYYAKIKTITMPKFKYKEILSLTIFLITILILMNFCKYIDFKWFHNNFSYYEFGFKWYLGLYRSLTYLLNIITSFAFILIIPNKTFTKLGTRTLNVYILHPYFIKLLSVYNVYSYLDTNYKRVSLIIVAAGITLILSSNIFSTVTNLVTGIKKIT